MCPTYKHISRPYLIEFRTLNTIEHYQKNGDILPRIFQHKKSADYKFDNKGEKDSST